MPITGTGWEFHMVRVEMQRRPSDGKRRTVGNYQVFHDGVAQGGTDMSGMFAETRGPGDNTATGIAKRRIEAGVYPLATQNGTKYKTLNYTSNGSSSATPRPGIELLDTGARTEILIHPARGFLWSIGCINPCTNLPDASEPITYSSSRRRVISLIEDLKSYLGALFPNQNGRPIPDAHVIVDGEP